MIIGVPKEIKIGENRVGLTDAAVQQLTIEGHTVYVEKDAGLGSRITNEAYEAVGGKILDSADEVWAKAQMIVYHKKPLLRLTKSKSRTACLMRYSGRMRIIRLALLMNW